MGPMPSPETVPPPEDCFQPLPGIARASILHGSRFGAPLEPDPASFAQTLQAHGASFVTLRRDGALRGCTGSLEPIRPLVIDVAGHGFSAAFLDPRFTPLRPEEIADLHVHVSVLGPRSPLPVASEADLLQQLRPGVDGLVLEEGPLRATFLPAVWEQLPAPREFVRRLKQKAGLPAGHWSPALRFSRYTVVDVEE